MIKTQVKEGNLLVRETSFPDKVNEQEIVAISSEIADAINNGKLNPAVKYFGIGITGNLLDALGFSRGIVHENGSVVQTAHPVTYSRNKVVVEIYQIPAIYDTTIRLDGADKYETVEYVHELQNEYYNLKADHLPTTFILFGGK